MSVGSHDRTAATPSDDMDVEGHGLDRVMGMDQLRRNERVATREHVEPELAPLTKRFPDLRSEAAKARRR